MCLNSGWTYDRQIMHDQNNLLQMQVHQMFEKNLRKTEKVTRAKNALLLVSLLNE